MRILKVIALLLDYPDEALVQGYEELTVAIDAAREISPAQRAALRCLLDELTGDDTMEVQARYDGLFERGRAVSLLLFEHVHGESRDRGQAMVDLMAQYEDAGFAIGVRELPDYIPLYLEYLSTCDDLTAREGLADVAHLLGLLAARLEERDSRYAACLRALLQIAGVNPQTVMEAARERVMEETRDDSLEAMDKAWEEEAVDFLKAEQQERCPSQPRAPGKAREEVPVPLHWVDFNQGEPHTPAPEVRNV
ncbi:nitrate reductase molybdenum cofactor assembly chaperone [Pseudomonas sp. MH2]|uniref:Nitrate reductase molybdenum cofactor assembly chaperone n=1 Tax=Pseudomonas machongensis TaxID=3110229 RepID=A0ABU5VGP7_9PSED|nr:nitrate reductase molybdenum cofactor assembly chaperone [Pseudomonas sp. MH2]MEA5672432.1 nitrate reductase molybdenum cofactor assembly chaperone [Pseudomonas sp. MH2]